MQNRGSAFLILIPALIVSTTLSAGVIVAPNGLENTEGNLQNCIPLSGCLDRDRYQQVYGSDQFASFTGPELITAMAFRPDENQPAFSNSFGLVNVLLSTTTAGPDALSAAFADNVGADETLVYAGSLTVSTASTGGPGAKDFDIVIAFQTPFLYDPSVGNLLLELRNLSGESYITFIDAEIDPLDSVSRLFNAGGGPNAVSGLTDTLGLVTQFTTEQPEPASEPSSMLLLGAAMSCIALLRRRSPTR